MIHHGLGSRVVLVIDRYFPPGRAVSLHAHPPPPNYPPTRVGVTTRSAAILKLSAQGRIRTRTVVVASANVTTAPSSVGVNYVFVYNRTSLYCFQTFTKMYCRLLQQTIRPARRAMLWSAAFGFVLTTWVITHTPLSPHHPVLLLHLGPSHPALDQVCYRLEEGAVIPSNICCRLHNYTTADVGRCVERALAAQYDASFGLRSPDEGFRSPNEYLFPFKSTKGLDQISGATVSGWSKSSGRNEEEAQPMAEFKWVFVGDSRIRRVYGALVHKLHGVRLRYRKVSTGGKWRRTHELMESLRIGKLHEDIEVKHLDYHLILVFYWDEFLHRLPRLLQEWGHDQGRLPDALHFGLHWLKRNQYVHRVNGPQVAGLKYLAHLQAMRADLARLTQRIRVVFHLQEQLGTITYPGLQDVQTNTNLQLYNSLAVEALSGLGVIFWSSPLSFANSYWVHCTQQSRQTLDLAWSCHDPLHIGWVMIDHYPNMILNDMCNMHLSLGHKTC
ncbi:uncharacterized protein LOC143018611 isoform X2 [Oratosquilla oratoria]|uniref:uncharacterized protein LOC143018611 isoform X2 n=1 Tax=Oratosquilla oratoria TaxID=337810 RepID=UPI003F772992